MASSRLELGGAPLDGRQIRVTLPVALDREAPLLQQIENLPVGFRAQLAFDRFYLESEQPQPSLAGHVGVELTEPAGRGAARIGEGRLSLLLAPADSTGEGVIAAGTPRPGPP